MLCRYYITIIITRLCIPTLWGRPDSCVCTQVKYIKIKLLIKTFPMEIKILPADKGRYSYFYLYANGVRINKLLITHKKKKKNVMLIQYFSLIFYWNHIKM